MSKTCSTQLNGTDFAEGETRKNNFFLSDYWANKEMNCYKNFAKKSRMKVRFLNASYCSKGILTFGRLEAIS
ncbi:hypothetical protein BpHYR1_008440 [Brachionus plicatilis]|uniref:Uncharacterized protein n=1 Tax=Brachionus plicatilis TaxID=10195 RepID=A0A3M7SB86_BRAPC|nr:hypothetical protein BpHYR1_008440 [Brachionus plicatilis]